MALYQIAELCIAMDCTGDIVTRRAEKYKIDCGTPVAHLAMTEAARQSLLSKNPALTDAECELIDVGRELSRTMLHHNGFVLHASAILYRGQAVLFSADSGVGKTTHTRLWQTVYGAGAVPILNDDKPAVRCMDGRYIAYGTPFSGNSEENRNESAPLRAIVLLERGASPAIRPLSAAEALPPLLAQTLRPHSNGDEMGLLLGFLDGLLRTVPVYQLTCNMDPESAVLAHDALFGKG